MEAGLPLGMLAVTDVTDEEVVERVKAGETELYEVIMRRYNQRLYRVARSIVGNDSEAEDVMQEAYVRAFQHLRQFEGRAKFATWLTKIAVYEAFMRLRRRSRFEEISDLLAASERGPEEQALNSELRQCLEAAIDKLPEKYRTVFMLREMEHLSMAEIAECLGLTVTATKIRLHRARAALKDILRRRIGDAAAGAFAFERPRCDRIVGAVFGRLGLR